MKRKKAANQLFVLHALFNCLPIDFREQVCKECKWSTPTFYRKMRLIKEVDSVWVSELSNAEVEMIFKVWQQEYQKVGLRFRRKFKVGAGEKQQL